jgi:hypothetical protein
MRIKLSNQVKDCREEAPSQPIKCLSNLRMTVGKVKVYILITYSVLRSRMMESVVEINQAALECMSVRCHHLVDTRL